MNKAVQSSVPVVAAALLLSLAALCSAQDPVFPCPATNSDAAPVPGGFQPVQFSGNDAQDQVDALFGAANASLVAYIETDGSSLVCNNSANIEQASVGIIQACSQVVAGTNYGIKFLVGYSCEVDAETTGQNQLVLNSIVFVPLPGSAEPEFQVQEVWRDTTRGARQITIDETPAVMSPAIAPASTAELGL